jgi:SET domain-containing protein
MPSTRAPRPSRPSGRAAAAPDARADARANAAPRAGADQPVAPAEPTAARPGGRRTQVRRSGIHGKGVFALQAIAAGETILDYQGEVIDWDEALRRHPHDPAQPNHTFYFHLDDGRVIDGGVNGNSARWINHACEPNCESEEVDGRIVIKALRDIAPGEELFFDYRLVIDERYTAKLKKEYACWCGAPSCRGTMLGPKR